MADLKISQLTALTAITADAADVFPLVDTSATTTKKITLSDVVEFVINSEAFSTGVAGLAETVDFTDVDNVLSNAVFS
jgi:hypothetical protein